MVARPTLRTKTALRPIRHNIAVGFVFSKRLVRRRIVGFFLQTLLLVEQLAYQIFRKILQRQHRDFGQLRLVKIFEQPFGGVVGGRQPHFHVVGNLLGFLHHGQNSILFLDGNLADFEFPFRRVLLVRLNDVLVNFNQLVPQDIAGLDVGHDMRIRQHLLHHFGHQILARLDLLGRGPVIGIQLVFVRLLLAFFDDIALDVFQFSKFILHPVEHGPQLGDLGGRVGHAGLVQQGEHLAQVGNHPHLRPGGRWNFLRL